MRTYRSPDPQVALAVQHESVRHTAARLGLTPDQFYASLAQYHLVRIDDELREISQSEEGESANLMALQQVKHRLEQDARSVIEYRQDELERGYAGHLDNLQVWLDASPTAQRMIDRDHLRTTVHADGATTDSLGALFSSAAHRVLFLAPLDGGFNAAALSAGNLPTLAINQGVYDALWAGSRLVVATSMRRPDADQIAIRDLRQHSYDFQEAVSCLDEILQVAAGDRLTASTIEPASQLVDVANVMRVGAISFVVFHELAHLLLPRLDERHEEEFKCDAFAARVICGSRSPLIICGMALGFLLTSTLFQRTGTHRASATHPRLLTRLYKAWTIAELEGGLVPTTLDPLLAAPARLHEAEVFRTETKPHLVPNFAMRLANAWRATPKHAATGTVATALIDGAVRLPTLAESTSKTVWIVDGQRGMAFVVDVMKAIALAREALKPIIWDDEDDLERGAVEAAVRLIAFFRHSEPPREAWVVLQALTAEGPNVPPRDRDFGIAMPYLLDLGVVQLDGRNVKVNTLIPTELYVSVRAW